MTGRQPSEKRGFVRSDLSVQTSVKLIDEGEYERKRAVKQSLAPDAYSRQSPRGDEDPQNVGIATADLASLLLQINDKLDRIMDIVGAGKTDPRILEVMETSNISASGVSMVLTKAVETGQLLDISLNLPNFPLGVFKTTGEVIRVSPRRKSESKRFEVGIRFLDLTDEERERIVAYTFTLQRKHIRSRKNLNTDRTGL